MSGTSTGSHQFAVFLLEAAVHGGVEVSVRTHEVCHDLCVVHFRQQVKGHSNGQGGEQLREADGRRLRDDDVVGSVEKRERRDSEDK